MKKEIKFNKEDKVLSKSYLLEKFVDIKNFDIELNSLFIKEDLNFFCFYKLGLLVSEKLGINGRLDEYKNFVKIYNDILFSDFKEEIESVIGIMQHKYYFSGSSFIRELELKDKADLIKNDEFKLEKTLELAIFNSIYRCNSAWDVYRQYETGTGRVDLLIKDKISKETVAIELKKSKATRRCVYQIHDYSKVLGCKGMLIAKSFDSDTLNLADQLNVKCYVYELICKEGSTVPTSIELNSLNGEMLVESIAYELVEIEEWIGFNIDYNFLNVDNLMDRYLKVIEFIIETAKNIIEEVEKTDVNICPCCGK